MVNWHCAYLPSSKQLTFFVFFTVTGRRCVPYNGESSRSGPRLGGRVEHHESHFSEELVR